MAKLRTVAKAPGTTLLGSPNANEIFNGTCAIGAAVFDDCIHLSIMDKEKFIWAKVELNKEEIVTMAKKLNEVSCLLGLGNEVLQ